MTTIDRAVAPSGLSVGDHLCSVCLAPMLTVYAPGVPNAVVVNGVPLQIIFNCECPTQSIAVVV